MAPEPEVIKHIIEKDHDNWEFSVEIKDNAKGEPQVTVKARSDNDAKDAGEKALAEYKRIRGELGK